MFREIALNICGDRDLADDILNECMLCLYEKSDEKKEEILCYVNYYVIRMIKLSYSSDSSGYRRKYCSMKYDRNVSVESALAGAADDSAAGENDERVVTPEDVEEALAACDWYERRVFKQYNATKTSFEKMAKKTGIPASSLFRSYSSARAKMRAFLNKKINNDGTSKRNS